MSNRKYTLWFLYAAAIFATVGAFSRIMTSFNHNEHMYIAAGILITQGKSLYRDFSYLQMPYLPFLYGAIFKLLNIKSYYLLAGKIVSFIFFVISSTTLFLLTLRTLLNTELSLCITALFLLNTTIVYPAAEVSNYIAPLAFSIMGFYAYITSLDNDRIRLARIALAGLCLAIAIGLKLTYATVIIPFVATSLFYPVATSSQKPTQTGHLSISLALIAGLFLGLLPVLFFMHDFKSFLFNNLGYHNINTQWRHAQGYTGPGMSLSSKLIYAHHLFLESDNLIVILGVILSLTLFTKNIYAIRKNSDTLGLLLAFLLVLVAIGTALAPTPSFYQYFAMPISFLFLLLVYSIASTSQENTSANRKLLLTLVLISLCINGPGLFASILKLPHRDKWAGLHIHDIAMKIKQTLPNKAINANAKIATLSPLFAMESNLSIYPEFSTGPFLYRIGDLLTPENRRHFVGTSPLSISKLFNNDAPAAIFTGFEGKLDKPLIKYAKTHHYIEEDISGSSGKLYVQP